MIDLHRFMKESLAIEGIYRSPNKAEVDATMDFLSRDLMTLEAVCEVQAVYAPDMPIRAKQGMNVRVGRHLPIPGSAHVVTQLRTIAHKVNDESRDPWRLHCEFETLHPFMDGNGRTGRILWAWHMLKVGQDPFSLPFLHRWYYQTLAGVDRQ